jgi:hypothetical protein
MEYSAGLTIALYEVGLRLISERRDLRGRLDLAHLAALSLACLAKQTLMEVKYQVRIEHAEWTNGRTQESFSNVGSLRFRVSNSKERRSKGRGRCQKSNEKNDSLDHGQEFN